MVSGICSQVALLPSACIRTCYGHAEVKSQDVGVHSWRAQVAIKSFPGMCFIPEMHRYLATLCQATVPLMEAFKNSAALGILFQF